MKYPITARIVIKKILITCTMATFLILSVVGSSVINSISLSSDHQTKPEVVPPHPNLIEQLERAGYSSATIINMLYDTPGGVNQPEVIQTAVTGTKQALVLLIDFPDMHKKGVSTTTFYDNLLFTDGTYPAPGSMRDFYQVNSYDQFDVDGTVNSWLRAANNSDYYAKYDGVHNMGFGPYPTNAPGLVREAVLAADPAVNYANYAEGGVVKNLFVIHAGQGAETNYPSDLIWSHYWTIMGGGGPATYVDGVLVNRYTMQPEYIYSAGDSTIGVFAHEYGHMLGLPDLYDTSQSQTGTTVGRWSLMSNGCWNGSNGDSPASFDAWCKIQLGWVSPNVVASNLTGEVIQPVYTDKNAVYKIWKNGQPVNEYFLLENRQKNGFDNQLPGKGLLIYHVDDTKFSNQKRCKKKNNWLCGTNHALVALEQADGLFELENKTSYGDTSDPFPGATNNTAFDFSSSPNSSSYAVSTDTLVQVADIVNAGADITADLIVKADPPGPLSPKGTITDATPTYKWKPVADAAKYRIQVIKHGSKLFTETVKSTVCTSKKCVSTPAETLTEDEHKWRVAAKVSGTWTDYSSKKTFTVILIDPPKPLSPKGDITDPTPDYKWKPVASATQYRFQVLKDGSEVFTETVSSSVCTAKKCTSTPSTTLDNGEHKWRVQAEVSSAWTAYSSKKVFTVR